MSRGIGRGQRCIWDDCANLLTRSCEEIIRRIITLVVFQTLLCCDDGRRLWWKATSRQLERGFHSTRYRDPLMTKNDCSRVNRRRTRHARKINCSFLPVLPLFPPPSSPRCTGTLFARSRITDELDDRGASRFAMHSHRASDLEASPNRGRNRLQWFHVRRVNATFIALFMIYRSNNDRCYHAGIYTIPLHILASTWNWRVRGNTMHQIREAW